MSTIVVTRNFSNSTCNTHTQVVFPHYLFIIIFIYLSIHVSFSMCISLLIFFPLSFFFTNISLFPIPFSFYYFSFPFIPFISISFSFYSLSLSRSPSSLFLSPFLPSLSFPSSHHYLPLAFPFILVSIINISLLLPFSIPFTFTNFSCMFPSFVPLFLSFLNRTL